MKFPAILIPADATTSYASAADEKAIDAKRAQLEGNGPSPMKRQHSFRTRHGHDDETLKLWGLSLGMTLDLLAHMAPPEARRGGAGALRGTAPRSAEARKAGT